ncbi:MAG TPA: DUF2809 domain-containing protein [Acidobacteriaceae bacterium]
MKARPVWLSILLVVLTIAAGITLRMAPLGLPGPVVKYGGSTMWALMIYWLVTTLLPAVRISTAAMAAGVLAMAVEFFKLYRSPGVDAFRTTLAGTLLLGRYFSFKDIVAYWIAIAAGALADAHMRG